MNDLTQEIAALDEMQRVNNLGRFYDDDLMRAACRRLRPDWSAEHMSNARFERRVEWRRHLHGLLDSAVYDLQEARSQLRRGRKAEARSWSETAGIAHLARLAPCYAVVCPTLAVEVSS